MTEERISWGKEPIWDWDKSFGCHEGSSTDTLWMVFTIKSVNPRRGSAEAEVGGLNKLSVTLLFLRKRKR